MRIIISPAKKMNRDTDSLDWTALPQFIDKAETILEKLRVMSYDELKKLWACNDKLAQLNYDRIGKMDLRSGLTPAILAYEGIQYQYMAPGVFSYDEFDYIQEHLRIVSGFYGLLRPFDGVDSYRLEIQAKLQLEGYKNLYAYWGDSLAAQLEKETDTIIDLASAEYSRAIIPRLSQDTQVITCLFTQRHNGKLVEKGTLCKMARGEMLRYMAELQIKEPAGIKAFDRQSYRFSAQDSTETKYVFIKE